MKVLTCFLGVISLCAVAASQQNLRKEGTAKNSGAAIVYAEGGAFMVDAPKGWITDRKTGQQHGICCVWYPEGSTWDDAESVMYPNIVTKGPGQKTLNEFMESDLDDFREHNPELDYEIGEDIPLKDNRLAKLRLFYNVNNGSSEAVAYIDEEKIIAFIVLSSKTKKGLNDSIPLLRTALQSYSFMHMRIVDANQGQKADSPKLPKN